MTDSIVGKKSNIFADFNNVYHEISSDILGGSPLDKTYLMAYLANTFFLKKYVEIGVYRGKSFFPMASVIAKNEGISIGIDPYNLQEAREYDIECKDLEAAVNAAMEKLNFDTLFSQVTEFKNKLSFSKYIQIIRLAAVDASFIFKNKDIDMLHIDGNHDEEKVRYDIKNYLPAVAEGGFIIVDDINWKSVHKVYNEIKDQYIVLYEHENFSILWNKKKSTGNQTKAKNLRKKIKYLNKKINHLLSNKFESTIPTIVVGILTYNHEKYIYECLKSVCIQNGLFNFKIIIIDDCSTDGNREVINDFLKNNVAKSNFEFEVIFNKDNIGVTQNLQKIIELAKGCQYLTFCGGDDYWLDSDRTIKHVDFLVSNPECALSFNNILLYSEDKKEFEVLQRDRSLINEVFETEQLIQDNFIGTLSATFFDGRYLELLPESIFNFTCYDWFFNVFYSTYGDIGFLRQPMSVYRRHSASAWNSLSISNKQSILITLIDKYNAYFNFDYDHEYTYYRDRCLNSKDDSYIENIDIVIIDDVFPHPMSGFRLEEFTKYYEYFQSIKVLTTGKSISVLSDEKIKDLIIDYKRLYPMFGKSLKNFTQWCPIGCKLLYFVFLHNAFKNLVIAETLKIPFIFTLYPGGGFAINDTKSDEKLRKVLSSPYFVKIIVTQQITYEYLLHKQFCQPDKIEYIFGVVTPIAKKSLEITKKHYKFTKKNLDICFVAHRYSKIGQDKGYDLFVEAGKKLSQKYENIYFHIVGPYDESIVDLGENKHRFKFYGSNNPSWFDHFYEDKDIILSPNRPGILGKGYFDGFPTAACIDAGLRKTAIFCSDELKLNQEHFNENAEIVIVPLNVAGIVEKIEFYYQHPDLLRSICVKGSQKIVELYGYEKQMLPRISILEKALANCSYHAKIHFDFFPPQPSTINLKSKFYKMHFARRLKTKVTHYSPPLLIWVIKLLMPPFLIKYLKDKI